MSEPDLSKLRIARGGPQAAAAPRRARRIWRWIFLALFVLAVGIGGYFLRTAVQVETATVAAF